MWSSMDDVNRVYAFLCVKKDTFYDISSSAVEYLQTLDSVRCWNHKNMLQQIRIHLCDSL